MTILVVDSCDPVLGSRARPVGISEIAVKRMIAAGAVLAAAAFGTASAHAADDAGLCSFMGQVIADANQQAGKMVNQAIRPEPAVSDCTAKTAAFKWTIPGNASELHEGWQDSLSNNWQNAFCQSDRLKEVLAAGWKVTAGWTTADGKEFVIEAKCE